MSVSYPTLTNARLTSPYGWRVHPVYGDMRFHSGIDLAPAIPNTRGVPIFATQSGVVRRVMNHTSLGLFVEIRHTADAYVSGYAHLASYSVSVGQTVVSGQQIGIMGTTGTSTGIHLDFTVATSAPIVWGSNGNTIDPMLYLEGSSEGGSTLPEQVSGNRYLNRAEMEINATLIWFYLSQNGWSMNAVSGMLGNMETESTINPGIWQNLSENAYHLGYGLVQWTPATNYLDWANARGLVVDRIESQIERFEFEIQEGLQWIQTSDYPISFEDFKTSGETPSYLAFAFLRNYERPANPNQPDRAEQAERWYDFLQTLDFDDVTPDNPDERETDLILLWITGALNGFNGDY